MPPYSKNNIDPQLIEEFIREVEATSTQVQKLLNTVRTSELDFVAIKAELRILCENVKDISALIQDKDGNVGILTRIALLEEKYRELEKDVERDCGKKPEDSGQPFAKMVLADQQGKWQMRIALATGILSLITSIVTSIAGHAK